MPAYTVEKSILIDAPLGRVHAEVTNFQAWPTWSPWLYVEPDADLTFSGEPAVVGHSYTWSGKRVGAGEMTLARVTDTEADYDLTFIKPFKSTAKVGFRLAEEGGQIRATWSMASKMPWFMAPMTKMMKTMIGMDYERGLRLLKDLVELGAVQSKTEVVGVVELPRFSYAGTTHHTTMAQIGSSAKAAFEALRATSVEGDAYVTIILKHKMMSGAMTYVAGIEAPNGSTPELTAGTDGGFKAFKVIHTGPYPQVGNAWSVAMSHVRSGPYKRHKKRHDVERYVNDPRTTDPKDLVTEIYIPIR